MGAGWGRRSVLVVMTSTVCCAGFACSSDGDPETLPSIAQVSVTSTSTIPATTTTLPPVDPQLVADCVEYVMFGAFTSNPLLTAMWDAADQDVATLNDDCESLGRTDPAALMALSDGLADLDVLLQSTTTSTTIPRRINPTTSTSAPPATEVPSTEVPGSEVPATEVPASSSSEPVDASTTTAGP